MRDFKVAASTLVAALVVLMLMPRASADRADQGASNRFRANGGSARSLIGGRQRWAAKYDGTGKDYDAASALAVAPSGSVVFVTGQSVGPPGDYDYATIAYQVISGRALWVARYEGPGNTSDIPVALAVTSDGSRVYVTGYSYAVNSEFATVAYDAGSGKQIWVQRYRGPGSDDTAYSLSTSPDGSKVFVTGASRGAGLFVDYATVAYNGFTGDRLWVARYNGPVNKDDVAVDVGVSPNGQDVFVTGFSAGPGHQDDWATVAYDADSGLELWLDRYDDRTHNYDEAEALTVAPDGSAIFVTGRSYGAVDDYLTIAYDAVTGDQIWVARFTPGSGSAESLVVAPDGARMYVTGYIFGSGNDDYGTIAYDASDGSMLWATRYKGRLPGFDDPSSLGVSPDGRSVFVTGRSQGPTHNYDFATVAYAT